MAKHRKQVVAVATVKDAVPAAIHDVGVTTDGANSIVALTEVLQALTVLPSDRAKARVLKFVNDYFDEIHGH